MLSTNMQRPPDVKSSKSTTLRWIAVNAGGSLLYLIVASSCWTEPEVRDIPGASGGSPFVWVFFALPFPFLFFILNAGLVLRVCFVYDKTREWQLNLWYLVVPAMWAAVILLDFSQH